MARMLATCILTFAAVLGVTALAFAEDTTVIEKHSEEHHTIEVAPPPRDHVVEEHTVVHQPPTVQKRTDTVVKTRDNDNDDDDNDND